MEVLKRAQKSNPKSRWWIKADATDMQKGLRESVKREWTGDVDLGDGKKEALHKEYMEKVRLINGLGKKGKGSLLADLKAILALIDSEEGFLKGGQAKAQKIYDKKRVESNVSDATRQALAWDLEGFKIQIPDIQLHHRCQAKRTRKRSGECNGENRNDSSW